MSTDFYNSNSISQIHTKWAVLASQAYRLREPSFRQEALSFACQIMTQAREGLHRIIDQLHSQGYVFNNPERVFMKARKDAGQWIAELRQHEIYLPISLEAWLITVGEVNLMGVNPQWSRPTYVESDRGDGYPLLSDPLVVELSEEYALYLLSEWQDSQEDRPADLRLDIAPDYLHKANISGGPPYELSAGTPSVDGILWNERSCSTFVSYLRLAFEWGGFPGLSYESAVRRKTDKARTIWPGLPTGIEL